MSESPYEQMMEVEHAAEVTIVRFKRRTILEPAAILAIRDRLLRLASEEGRRTILVNFQGVESMTSAMLGEFVLLHRTLSECGGQLAFCRVEPFLMHVFKIVKLPERIAIYDDEATALQALASTEKTETQP
jgi:anti-sigma B factor antagonist